MLIENATIVDGTGKHSYDANVLIKGGKIAEIGKPDPAGEERMDARGLVLAPGFIDIHTHYDPQLCWDGLATPSIEHGCTTVVTGNCSLTLAPVRKDEGRRKLVGMFERIEDIEERVFDAAVSFEWESFPEYMDHIGRHLGINVGALVGHSALRQYVMGAASQERTARREETEEMCQLLREAMAAGALGLSISHVDTDENGVPVPSRFADMDEKRALCRAMAESGRGMLQTVPMFIDPKQQLANIAELAELSIETGVSCSLAPIIVMPVGDLWKRSLDALDAHRARGARVFAQSMPRTFDLRVRMSETSFLFYGSPVWDRVMQLPLPERLSAFGDPATREALMADAGRVPALLTMTVGEVYSEENRPFVGKRLFEVAAEQNKLLTYALLDMAIADEMRTVLHVDGLLHADRDRVTEILRHPLVHIGASDAGAHVTQFCGAGDTSYLLSQFVREEQRLSLEEAIHGLTGKLARDWGIRDRGVIEVGKAADLVLFDPDLIERQAEHFVQDFPAGGGRYLHPAEGIEAVFVNGQLTLDGGRYTDARAGHFV